MKTIESPDVHAGDPDHDIAYAAFLRRFNALIIDTIVLVVGFAAMIVFITIVDNATIGAIGIGIIVATLFLYDPVLVSTRGGTIGHYRMNMRVVDQQTRQRIGLLRAILRSWVKLLLGFFSFFFMLLTRRHQALHDVASRSTVVIHNLGLAEPHHYRLERPTEFIRTSVPKWRRVIAILLYSGVAFVLYSVVGAFFISWDCLEFDRCTPGEDAFAALVGGLMLVTFGLFLVLGWKGLLIGARGNAKVEDSNA